MSHSLTLTNSLAHALVSRVAPSCRNTLESLKAQAAAVRPLPAGQYYSGAIATGALLAAAMYFTAPAKYDSRGGLYVHFVVDARGGRWVGLPVPVHLLIQGVNWYRGGGVAVWQLCA